MRTLFSILFCLLYTLSYASNKDSIIVTKKGKYEIKTIYRSNFGGVIVSKNKKVGTRKTIWFITTFDSSGSKVNYSKIKKIRNGPLNNLKTKKQKISHGPKMELKFIKVVRQLNIKRPTLQF